MYYAIESIIRGASLLSIYDCLPHTDLNECSVNNGGCDGQCTNTQGSYTCSCGSGYELGANGQSCDGKLESHKLKATQYST